MSVFVRRRPAIATLLAVFQLGLCSPICTAQPADSSPSDALAASPEPRGVWRVVDPAKRPVDTHNTHDVVGLLRINKDFGARPWKTSPAKGVRFEHSVWALEFSYKPVRFVNIDIPRANGRYQQKQVWYLPYRVRNTGDAPVEFAPRLVLESLDTGKVYPEQIVPSAMDAIVRREHAGHPLLNSAEIAGEIPPASSDEEHSVKYGIAMFTDVDPATDRFSIYVQGLTNAYRWEDAALEGNESPRLFPRVLQLNFWRPGDEHNSHEREIRIGVPDDRYHFGARDFVPGQAELTPEATAKIEAIAPIWRHILDATPVFTATIEPSYDPVVGNVPLAELVGAIDAQRKAAADLDELRRQKVAEEFKNRGISESTLRVAIQPPDADNPSVAAAADPAAPSSVPATAPRMSVPRNLPGEFWVYVTPEFLYKGTK